MLTEKRFIFMPTQLTLARHIQTKNARIEP